MSDNLTVLLRRAADERCALIRLPPASEVAQDGRARQRRRLVGSGAAAALVAVGLVISVQSLRPAHTSTLVPAGPTTAAVLPSKQRLLQVLATAQPPLSATLVDAASPSGEADLGAWTASGRVRDGEALTATTSDGHLSVDWTHVRPPVHVDELDGIASKALPGVPEHIIDTGVAQTSIVQSRVYVTNDGLLSAYAWSRDGGVASARAGGGADSPGTAKARELELLVRRILQP